MQTYKHADDIDFATYGYAENIYENIFNIRNKIKKISDSQKFAAEIS